jgi:hypothetical protein
MIDPQFRIAPPPVELALTPLDNTVGFCLMGICTLIVLVAVRFAWREYRRNGSPILLLIILGGAVTNLAEPFVDLVGACWHPEIGQITLFEHMERKMPLWLFFPYVAYFGAQAMTLYYVLSTGATKRTMWLWLVIPVIADIVLEESLLSFSDNLYVYYGNQPLRFHVFPIWWAAANTIGIYISAVVLTLFTPLLKGWRLLFVPFCTLLCYAGASGIVALPAIIVINTELPFWATQLGGVLTFALAALVVAGFTQLIASDSPYRVVRTQAAGTRAETGTDGRLATLTR